MVFLITSILFQSYVGHGSNHRGYRNTIRTLALYVIKWKGTWTSDIQISVKPIAPHLNLVSAITAGQFCFITEKTPTVTTIVSNEATSASSKFLFGLHLCVIITAVNYTCQNGHFFPGKCLHHLLVIHCEAVYV